MESNNRLKGDIMTEYRHVMAGYRRSAKRMTMITLMFAVIFTLWLAPVFAQSSEGTDLKEFYQQNCARCHGADGSAVGEDGKKLKGQDFTDQDWQRKTGDEKMVKVILKGKFFGLAMPKFKDKLTEEESQRMVTDIIRNSKKGQVIAP